MKPGGAGHDENADHRGGRRRRLPDHRDGELPRRQRRPAIDGLPAQLAVHRIALHRVSGGVGDAGDLGAQQQADQQQL